MPWPAVRSAVSIPRPPVATRMMASGSLVSASVGAVGVMNTSRAFSSSSLSALGICARIVRASAPDTGGMKQAPLNSSTGHCPARAISFSCSSAVSGAPLSRLALSRPILARSSAGKLAVISLKAQ